MQKPEIDAHLDDLQSWQNASEAVKERFVEAMKDYNYGYPACTSAWTWYYFGWCAGLSFGQ